MQPTPVFLPGKVHGQRSLAGYSLWGGKESDTTQRLTLHFHLFRFLVVATHSNPCLCHFGAFCPRLLSIFSSYWTRAHPTQNGLILTYILITSAKAPLSYKATHAQVPGTRPWTPFGEALYRPPQCSKIAEKFCLLAHWRIWRAWALIALGREGGDG